MVSCSDFIRDYSDYCDGLLPPPELVAAQIHLDTCSSCQSYVRVVNAGIEELLSIPEIEPSYDFVDRLQHRLYHIDSEKGVASREASGASVAFVLVLLALIGGASWFPVVRQAANTVELPPVHAAAPVERTEVATLFTSGPLLLPTSLPARLVSNGARDDVFAGYALGTYVAGRQGALRR